MPHNSNLKKLVYIFELEPQHVLEVLQIVKPHMNLDEVEAYLSEPSSTIFQNFDHENMRAFLDGLIISSRGENDRGVPSPDPSPLSNNAILKKIRIALNLLEEDVYEIFEHGNLALNNSEYKAIFRSEQHKNFKPCSDQMLKSFFEGLQAMYEPDRVS